MLVLGTPTLSAETYPDFPSLQGTEARSLWLDTCEGCHAYGIAGAPNPKSFAEWAPRIAKGKSVLYNHALEGFFGAGGTMMPPRGGNDSLTDEEVKLAVDYMVALAESYGKKNES